MTGLAHRRAAAAAALAVLTAALASTASGCARMDAALRQQWVVVQLRPGTTLAAARHAALACSRVPNLRLVPVRPAAADPGLVESVRYNATAASDADLARLQQCLQRFPAFQYLTLTQPGDS